MSRRIFVSLLLMFATLAVFWPASKYGFVSWDDSFHVYENPYLNPPTLENTLHFWTESYKTLYIPFTYTAWSILAWLSNYLPPEGAAGGLNPALFHTANIFLHVLNTLIVFSILSLLLRHGFGEAASRKEPKPPVEIAAGVGALIFAVHPLHVEPVVWVTGMKGMLCGLFSLFALREYLVYAIASKNGDAGGRLKLRYVIAFAAFAAAMLSKPVAVVIPLVAFILDRWAINRTFKESAVALAPWFIAAVLFALLSRSVHQSGIGLISVPLWAKFFIAGDTLAFYLYKLVFPLQLGIDYGRNPDYVMQHWWGYVTWLFPFALVAAVWFLKERKLLLVSLGIFAASLLPTLGFVTFLFQFYSTAADRYAYLAVLGLSLMVSSLFLNRFSKPVALFCLAAVILFGIRSSLQVPAWKNNIALYTNALKVNPVSFISHNNMGIAMRETGNLDKAISHYEKTINIRPTHAKTHYNLGIVLEDKGKLNEAISSYLQAIQYKPDYPTAYYNLGVILTKQGKLDSAISSFQQALRFRPDFVNAHYNLGAVLAQSGKPAEAASSFRQVLKFQPDNTDAPYSLGIVLARQGKLNEAVIHFSQTVKIRPDFEPAKRQLAIAKAKLRNK